jgi:hypothetical protein
LFPGRLAGSLPRFTATSPVRPGLTVGSTLDGGPNWADDANRFLVACEVDSGVVITLMGCYLDFFDGEVIILAVHSMFSAIFDK